MPCLQAIEGEDNKNPFICHIMNLLWLLSGRGRHKFVSAGYQATMALREMKEWTNQQETLDIDIDPLASVHYTDLMQLANSYIQQLVQTKWDVAVHVAVLRLQNGHTKATKSHILSRGPPTACHHCGQTLSIDHMLLECAVLQEFRDEYFTADFFNTLWDNTWYLHSGVPTRNGILLSDMNGQALFTIDRLSHPWSDGICLLQLGLGLRQYNRAWVICLKNESNPETHLHVLDGY